MMSQVGNAYLSKKFREIYSSLSEENKKACLPLANAYLGKDETGKAHKKSLDARKAEGEQIIHSIIAKNPGQPVPFNQYVAMGEIKEVFDKYHQEQSSRKEKARANSLKGQIEQWGSKYSPETSAELGELVNAYQGLDAQGKRAYEINSYDSRYEKANGIVKGLVDASAEVKDAAKELSNIFSVYESKRKTKDVVGRNVLRDDNKEALSSLEDAVNNYTSSDSQVGSSDSKKGFFSGLYHSAKGKLASFTAAGLATLFFYGGTISSLPTDSFINVSKVEASPTEGSTKPDLSTPGKLLEAIKQSQEGKTVTIDLNTGITIIDDKGTGVTDTEAKKPEEAKPSEKSSEEICLEQTANFKKSAPGELLSKELTVSQFSGDQVKTDLTIVVNKECVGLMKKDPGMYVLVQTNKGNQYEGNKDYFVHELEDGSATIKLKLSDPDEVAGYIGLHDRKEGPVYVTMDLSKYASSQPAKAESAPMPQPQPTLPEAPKDALPQTPAVKIPTPGYTTQQKSAKDITILPKEEELKSRFDVKWEKSPLEKGIRSYKLDKKGNLEVVLNKALTKAMNEDDSKYLLVKTNNSIYEVNTIEEKKGLGILSLKLKPKEKIEFLGIEKRKTEIKDNVEVTTMTYVASIKGKPKAKAKVMTPGSVTAKVSSKKVKSDETKDLRIRETQPQVQETPGQTSTQSSVSTISAQETDSQRRLNELEGKVIDINYRDVGKDAFASMNRIDITERKGWFGNIQEANKEDLKNTSLYEEILRVVREKNPSYIFVDSRVYESYGNKGVPKVVFEFGNSWEDGRRLEKITSEKDANLLEYQTVIDFQVNNRERLFERRGFNPGIKLDGDSQEGETPEVIAQRATDFVDFEIKKAQNKNLLTTPWHKREVQRSNPAIVQPLQAHFVVGQNGKSVADIAAIVVTADGVEVDADREGKSSRIVVGASNKVYPEGPGGGGDGGAGSAGASGGGAGPGGPGVH